MTEKNYILESSSQIFCFAHSTLHCEHTFEQVILRTAMYKKYFLPCIISNPNFVVLRNFCVQERTDLKHMIEFTKNIDALRYFYTSILINLVFILICLIKTK